MTTRTIALITPFFDAATPSGGVLFSVDVARQWLRRGSRVCVLTSDADRRLNDLAAAMDDGQLSLHPVLSAEQVRFSHAASSETYCRARETLRSVRPDVVHVHNTHGMLSAVRAALDARAWPCILTALDFALLCFNHYLSDGSVTPCSGPDSVSKCRACLATGGLRGAPRWLGRWLPVAATRRIWPRYVRLEHYKTAGRTRQLARSILSDLDAIIAPSPIMVDRLASHGAVRERVHECVYGVAPEKCVRPAKTDSRRVRLAFLGGAEPVKGLYLLLEAAAALPDGLDLELQALGSERVRGLVEAAGPAARRYLRHAPPAFGRDLGAAHAGFDAVLVPSVWHENSPFVVLESLANGTPVIAADQAGIRHLIRHGENGWLVPPGSVTAWAAAIRQAACCPDRLRAMQPHARFERSTADFLDDVAGIEAAAGRSHTCCQ